ncbi:phage GP46 family protein [Hydrogenovibrio marinus]|uniref:Phage protein GP46 n=1 Tax=Hydrogenovibrio marinus TaxID=28885 RepID=A0A066ZMW2_HYDMR|nr:phage GP46 family protein [Hydrogenovibrio marinus]KDN94847.1 hypothetical protein EI16_00595 [Hydrogenovibrio marinus]BBN59307.1 hypothetical protein HVMH_0901 [Hydrogenovibrio marinus]
MSDNKFEFSALYEPLSTQIGLRHAILQSLLNFGKAHANDDLEPDKSKRGWWANEFLSGVDCRDWTLERSKQTDETKSKAIHYTKVALDWLITNDNAKAIDVTAYYDKDWLIRVITVTLKDGTKFEVKV